jgi:hypothetical protein
VSPVARLELPSKATTSPAEAAAISSRSDACMCQSFGIVTTPAVLSTTSLAERWPE